MMGRAFLLAALVILIPTPTQAQESEVSIAGAGVYVSGELRPAVQVIVGAKSTGVVAEYRFESDRNTISAMLRQKLSASGPTIPFLSLGAGLTNSSFQSELLAIGEFGLAFTASRRVIPSLFGRAEYHTGNNTPGQVLPVFGASLQFVVF
ncbi:MAG TPA: hypothetical protein VF035_01415 [Longimicrobiales bacterium]